MKKADLLRQIEELRRRVETLEARPVYVPQWPAVEPFQPFNPWQPVWIGPPVITSGILTVSDTTTPDCGWN